MIPSVGSSSTILSAPASALIDGGLSETPSVIKPASTDEAEGGF